MIPNGNDGSYSKGDLDFLKDGGLDESGNDNSFRGFFQAPTIMKNLVGADERGDYEGVMLEMEEEEDYEEEDTGVDFSPKKEATRGDGACCFYLRQRRSIFGIFLAIFAVTAIVIIALPDAEKLENEVEEEFEPKGVWFGEETLVDDLVGNETEVMQASNEARVEHEPKERVEKQSTTKEGGKAKSGVAHGVWYEDSETKENP